MPTWAGPATSVAPPDRYATGMRIGIVADVHDALSNLRAALHALRDTDALLVAGDLCSPFVLPILAGGFAHGDVHIVFGNNDGDRFRMERVAANLANVHLHGEAWTGELGGRTIAMNHFPAVAVTMDPARFHLIVFGHDHRLRTERTEAGGWLLDPGSLLGYDPAERQDVSPTFLIYDTESDEVQSLEIPSGSGSARTRA